MMDIHKIEMAPVCRMDLNMFSEVPGPYCMSFGFDIGMLAKSIEACGIINAPFIVSNKDGGVEVVSGYRRILALKGMNAGKVVCRDLFDSGLSPFELLLFNLYDNLGTRPFNTVEKGMILNRMHGLIDKTLMVNQYMPLLDLPSHEPTLDLLIQMDKELENDEKEYLATGAISLSMVRMLLEMGVEERRAVFRIISDLKLNMNQQKQFMDYILDISHKDSLSYVRLLNDPEIRRIRSDEGLNTPQKAKKVLGLLRRLRFPSLISAEEAFHKRLAGLRLAKGVSIHAPEYFETDDYRLEISFSDGMDLRKKMDALYRTEGLEGLGDPWRDVS
jgi:hypothetical protein